MVACQNRSISPIEKRAKSSANPLNLGLTLATDLAHDGAMDRKRDRWTIDDIRTEFRRYCDLINASERTPSTKGTYIQHADRFVRWLAGEVEV